MWSRSGGVMLFQNSVAWLKWSSNDCGALADLDARRPARGTCTKLPSVTDANGHPPPIEFGAYGATPVVDGLLAEAVALVVVHRRRGPVDRELVEVRAAEPGELGVEVGEHRGPAAADRR